MDLYAVLSDIHGNHAALEAVLEDAQSIAKEETGGGLKFISLGDVVDYGPQPNECMAWACREVAIAIQGNHDRVAIAPLYQPPLALARDVWPTTLWTRRVLEEKYKAAIRTWKPQIEAPTQLPFFTLFHSSLVAEDQPIHSVYDARHEFDKLKTNYGIFGHTHFQGYFLDDALEIRLKLTSSSQTDSTHQFGWDVAPLDTWIPLPGLGQRALFNPGSVGQPRPHGLLTMVGHDARAAYMLLKLDTKGGAVKFRRVTYDTERTINLLREMRWPDESDSIRPHTGPIPEPNVRLQSMTDLLEHFPERLSELIERLILMIAP